jgi:hypothetical protein
VSEQVGESQNCVGTNYDHDLRRDSWRLFESGQFIDYRSFSEDLLAGEVQGDSRLAAARPGDYLLIKESIRFVTEAFRFAAQLSRTKVGIDGLMVSIRAHQLSNRELYLGGQDTPFFEAIRPYRASAPDFSDEVEISANSMDPSPDDLAIDYITALFKKFSWTSSRDLLRAYQAEFLTA